MKRSFCGAGFLEAFDEFHIFVLFARTKIVAHYLQYAFYIRTIATNEWFAESKSAIWHIAAPGHADSTGQLAHMYLNGLGVAKDYARALKLYQ